MAKRSIRERLRRRLVIMAKAPQAGRVKSRLSRDIGTTAATNFYRHTLAAVTGRLARDTRWHTLLSIAPATALHGRNLPPGLSRLAQSSGDIGQRMQAIFDQPFVGPVVVVGSDIPEMHPTHIAAAFDALANHDAVFGPAVDGGFWLVGLKRSPRVIAAFGEVRWSSPTTLQDCLEGLGGYRVATVSCLRDVDEAADLTHLRGNWGRRIVPVDCKNSRW